MNDEQPTVPQSDDDFEDVLGAEGDFATNEYRLSTRPGVVSGGS